MCSRFRKFIALNSEERRLFIEAYFLLGVMRAAIKFISFKRLTRSLDHSKERSSLGVLPQEQLRTAIIVGKVIEQAANNTPWESACLVQSLTAQRMLEKRGVPGVFYLGAMKDGRGDGKMKAHAWTQCGDTVITGAKGYEDFTVLSVFGWRGK